MIKKILFITIFMFALPCHSFNGFDFLHKQNNAKKAAAAKIGTGFALFLPIFTRNESFPLQTCQFASGLASGIFLAAGAYQMAVETLAEEDAKSSLHPNTHRFDNFVRKIVTDPQFLQGAAFSAAGFLLANENATADTSVACTAIGLALMGYSLAQQFNKDYMPQIKAYFNK